MTDDTLRKMKEYAEELTKDKPPFIKELFNIFFDEYEKNLESAKRKEE